MLCLFKFPHSKSSCLYIVLQERCPETHRDYRCFPSDDRYYFLHQCFTFDPSIPRSMFSFWSIQNNFIFIHLCFSTMILCLCISDASMVSLLMFLLDVATLYRACKWKDNIISRTLLYIQFFFKEAITGKIKARSYLSESSILFEDCPLLIFKDQCLSNKIKRWKY